jgi:hypothetical protein
MIEKLIQDKNKLVSVRLNDFNYPRTALYLPTRYRKEAMCEAHDCILGGHNAAHKTYLKISTSYFWPKMRHDIERHQNFGLRCQQRKKSTNKRTALAPLPIPAVQTSGFTPIFLAQCSQQTVIKNLSFASQMLSLSKLWSLQLPKRKLKWWRMPFSRTGSQNLEFRRRYTLTGARNSSTNSRRSFSSCSTFDTQKPHQRIRSAMPKWKCLTRQ